MPSAKVAQRYMMAAKDKTIPLKYLEEAAKKEFGDRLIRLAQYEFVDSPGSDIGFVVAWSSGDSVSFKVDMAYMPNGMVQIDQSGVKKFQKSVDKFLKVVEKKNKEIAKVIDDVEAWTKEHSDGSWDDHDVFDVLV